MKKILFKISCLMLSFALVSCELDLQEDPNNLTPEQGDFDAVLAGLQLQTENVFNGATDFGMDVTRMHNMFGSQYENAYNSTTFNALWEDIYAEVLVDAELLSNTAKEAELFHHAGVADVLGAYSMVLAVDYFGDVPYEDALAASEGVLEPALSQGSTIYDLALVRLDSAIVNLQKTPLRSIPDLDATNLFAVTNAQGWIKIANSLKLKIALQRRLIDGAGSASIINSLTNLAEMPGDDFAFQYGTNAAAPDSRHPWFTENYVAGANQYMSNYYMDLILNDVSSGDPRMIHYFYRQTTSTPTNPQVLPCVNRAAPAHYPVGTPFCFVSTDGYWGRDHLDDDGIPPDTELRTIYGAYPAGGVMDTLQNQLPSATGGLAGAGIAPMFMHWYNDFMLAEAALTIGSNGDPRSLLQSGIEKSMDYVTDFGINLFTEAKRDSVDSVATVYVDEVLADFDAADANGRLAIVTKEFFKSLWGNGVEAYNLYRRTGMPTDLQPALLPQPGVFYRSFIYPQAFVQRNSNANQKPLDARVFWDDGSNVLD